MPFSACGQGQGHDRPSHRERLLLRLRHRAVRAEDIEKIEARWPRSSPRMCFVRKVVSRAEALRLFADKGETYKVEIIESIPEGEEISLYQHGGSWTCAPARTSNAQGRSRRSRCCPSPVPTGAATKRNPQLQRVYGTPSHQRMTPGPLDSSGGSQARDHRVLGRQLDLFSVDDLVDLLRALAPKGAIIRTVLEELLRRELVRRGYEMSSPRMWRASSAGKVGHLAHYKKSIRRHGTGRPALSGPAMNCPFHIAIYRSAASLASRTAHPLRRVCTVYRYSVGCVARPAARAWVHPGRRPPIIARRPDRRKDGACLRSSDVLKVFGFADVKLLATRPESFMVKRRPGIRPRPPSGAC